MGAHISRPTPTPTLTSRITKPPSRPVAKRPANEAAQTATLSHAALQLATSLHLGEDIRPKLLTLTPSQRARVRCMIHMQDPTLLDHWPSEATIVGWEGEKGREKGRVDPWEEQQRLMREGLASCERVADMARERGAEVVRPQPVYLGGGGGGLKRAGAVRGKGAIRGVSVESVKGVSFRSTGLGRTKTPRMRPQGGGLRVVNARRGEGGRS